MAAAAVKNGASKPKRKRARKTRTRVVENDSSSSSSSSSSEEDAESKSSSSDSSSEDEVISKGKGRTLAALKKKEEKMDLDNSTDSSSDSSSDSPSSSEEEEDSSDENDTQATPLKKQIVRRLFTPPPEPLTSWPESERSRKYLPISLEQKFEKLIAQSDEATIKFTQNNSLMQEQRQRSEAIERMQKNVEAQNARQGGSILDNKATSIPSTDDILDPASLAKRREELERGWMKVMIEEYGNELDALRKKEPTLGTSNADRRMPLLIDSLQAGAELFSDGINASLEDKRKAPKLHSIDETAIFINGLKED